LLDIQNHTGKEKRKTAIRKAVETLRGRKEGHVLKIRTRNEFPRRNDYSRKREFQATVASRQI
jgi:hypothetical protein